MKQRLVIITEIIAPYRIPIFNALAEHSCVDPHVIFLSETDPSLRDWDIYRQEIRFSYEVLPSFRKRVGKYNFLLNTGITPALEHARPDSILCGGYSYLAAWQAAAWARRAGVPFLMWVESNPHDQRRGYPMVEYLKKKMLHASSGFVVPGQASREYLESFGIESESIFFAPNAVNNEFFSGVAAQVKANPACYRDEYLPEHYFLFVGRLVYSKGVFDLLDAYASLPAEIRRRFGLVFAGSGIAEAALKKAAQAICPGLVCFSGFAQRERLAVLYSLADLLVLPTHSDTWGLVVNEAMACGLPVICSSVAGCASDLVADGENGCIVTPRNIPQLASDLETLARDPELRLRMGRNSRQRIANFSPAKWAEGVSAAVHALQAVPYG